MDEKLIETIKYYAGAGARSDQTVLVSMLRELQQQLGGALPANLLSQVAEALDVKESYLQAVIRRIPSLRLADHHVLELCSGPNCGKHTALCAAAERLCKKYGIKLKYMPCMRLCAKGPNIRIDGRFYHRADEELLMKLLEDL